MLRILIVCNVCCQMLPMKFLSNMINVNLSKPIMFLSMMQHVLLRFSIVGKFQCAIHNFNTFLGYCSSKECLFSC